MSNLSRYIDVIVEPTFDDFTKYRTSRHAFLACVAIFHAVDRAAYPRGAARLRQQWCKASLEFKLVDIAAHHFKHVKSTDERIPASRPGIPIGFALGFNEAGDEMELRNFFFVMRDAIKFLRRKAAEVSRSAA